MSTRFRPLGSLPEGDRGPCERAHLLETLRCGEQRGARVSPLGDAVRQQPGVSIQQTTPGQGTIYVRGFSGRAVGSTVDGVRLNTAFFRAGNNPYLAVDFQELGTLEGAVFQKDSPFVGVSFSRGFPLCFSGAFPPWEG